MDRGGIEETRVTEEHHERAEGREEESCEYTAKGEDLDRSIKGGNVRRGQLTAAISTCVPIRNIHRRKQPVCEIRL